MTDKLPPNLLVLFQPRPPLRYLPPCDIAPETRRTPVVTGVAQYLAELRKPDPNYVPTETLQQQRERHREEKKKAYEEKLVQGIKSYDPTHDVHIRGDPFRTLFVARLSYDVQQADLEREFGRFGPIERIRLVKDKNTNKPRGYAFILYERDKDMKAAFKETDGLRIKDRRIVVDVERGRTTKGWKPRRLGGGLGGRGYTKQALQRPSGPTGFDRGPPGGPGGFRGGGGFGGRGGFRGGFSRGGFRGGFDGGPPPGGRFGDRGPRGGIGFTNGGDAPPNAPTGPGGGRFGRPDRGGFGGGGFRGQDDRGGYRGGDRDGGFRGGRDGGRDGARDGARDGPRESGGYDRSHNDHDGGRGGDRYGGGSSRDFGGRGDRERDSGRYGGRDRDRDGDRDGGRDRDDYRGGRGDDSRKRPYDGDTGYGGESRRRRY